ncbi:hypothetical protein F4778DRAFT_367078 [Xylariomycetidae sp. FL2044]|nr:hypothetical protein F4778DRAFT_367078 [Xylariomycetidae sp. FL2044]
MDSITTIDSEGDLALLVGSPDNWKVFLVCSRAMARASNFFKKLIFGPSAGLRQPDGDTWMRIRTLHLPKEDLEALSIVLHILHGRVDEVPFYLSLIDLFRVTIITERYGLASRLRPWASRWIEPHRHLSVEDEVDVLSIIVLILHDEVEAVPPYLPLFALFRIMVITDGYDLKPQFQPWVSQWILPYHDVPVGDDLEALSIVVRTLHGDSKRAPLELSLKTLFKVTIITERYDLTSRLRP